MTAATFDLIKDIFFLLFFIVGTLWMWGKLKFAPATQNKMEHIFRGAETASNGCFLSDYSFYPVYFSGNTF